MRDIKFRQPWYRDNGQFDSFTYWGRIKEGVVASPSQRNLAMPREDEQYTGLKDKNDKEIYEGDIVECNDWHPKHWEIKFIEGGFCGWNDRISIPTDINMWYDSLGCHISVIGNIHENPELMKE